MDDNLDQQTNYTERKHSDMLMLIAMCDGFDTMTTKVIKCIRCCIAF